ncbi:MAG: hypothetical protein LBM23_06165 [Propionibacteriaceae bacterium]|nr:hypothetical protein [Propionibacteriaceae bacterium]
MVSCINMVVGQMAGMFAGAYSLCGLTSSVYANNCFGTLSYNICGYLSNCFLGTGAVVM